MGVKEIAKEPDLETLLKTRSSDEWLYMEINGTLYTDLNEVLTSSNLAAEVLRHLDPQLTSAVNEILCMGLDRTQEVKAVFNLLGGYPISELEGATYKARQTCDLFPEIKEMLALLYPRRIAILTGIYQLSAEVYTKNKICPLYYQNIPPEGRGGRIAVVGTLAEEQEGILTGKVLAVPDNGDRAVLALIDILASLGYEHGPSELGIDQLKKMTNYPCPLNRLDYRF